MLTQTPSLLSGEPLPVPLPPEAGLSSVNSTQTSNATPSGPPVGSSTPADTGSLTADPPPSDLLATTLPEAATTANSEAEFNPPASETASEPKQDLMMARTVPDNLANLPPSTIAHWSNPGGGSWNAATNWTTGVPGRANNVVMDAARAYTVTSASSVDINNLVVHSGVNLSSNPGTLFTVEGSVADNGIIRAGPSDGNQISTVDIKGNVHGTGSLHISDQAVLEIGGAVSGQLTKGSFSGIIVSFDAANGELVLDDSAQFQGLITSSSPGAALAAGQLIDLKDLAFTSSMSTSVQYDVTSNTSKVNFSNGSTAISLLFSGQHSTWTLNSDGHGGTVVADPSGTHPLEAALAPSNMVGASSATLAQSATTDPTGSPGTNASPSDPPVGSSTPANTGSLTADPPPSDLLATTLPEAATTTANSEAEFNPPASETASEPKQDLMMSRMLPDNLANFAPSTIAHWSNPGGGSWNVATNWTTGVPGVANNVVMDATRAYTVTSTSSVDINNLVVHAGVNLSSNPGTLFTVEGSVVDAGIIRAGPSDGNQISTVDIKGNVNGTGSLHISDQAVLEIGGAVSGRLTKRSFSGITVSFDAANGELVLDHSAQFQGLIASSSPGAALAAGQLIDLKDLAFTSSMSTSVQYDVTSNTSKVNFSNGSSTVSLLFSGKDSTWTLNTDGHGGTVVADPSGTNPIVQENQLPGTPRSTWWVNPGADSTNLEGFTTAISTNIGDTVQFKIDDLTGSSNYQIQIYRLGYYGGNGARLVTTLQHQGTAPVQPAPTTNPATGEVDAGNWSVTDSWSIPTTAVSGVYVANVVQGTQVFQIPFVVKDPNSTSDIVFQTSDETWQAYNGWGGASLYGGNGPSQGGAAYAVSYNRPIMTRDGVGLYANSDDSVFTGEYPAIYWLEENGYNVSYISGMDTATNGALLLNHKVFMDAGHDEYWTDSQVANVQAAANAGVNLTFLSGNEIFWQTQFTPSIDSSKTANRTLVTYKDSHFEQLINPSGQGTGTFEAPTNWGGAAMPSNALTGTVFSVDESGSLGTIKIPYSMTQLRFWRNTSVAATTPGQTASLESGLLGYEWDSSPDNGFMPAGLIDLSSTTVQESSAFNTEFGNVDTSGTATHNLVEYRDPTSGALVFGAGTVFWSWGLSNQHDSSPDGNQTNADPNVQQAMVNLFADMGVQPQTLQASLVIASQSTDHTAPTSKITSVSSSSVIEGQTVTVSGTATDVGGVIGGVQISTDGGKTWHVTSGQVGTQTVNWTYTFNAPAKGSYSIETRAVDDSLNLETPGSGVSYTVSPSTSLNLFGSSATPATADVSDPHGVEVGLKFTSSTNGQITGIRFYKGSLNTGAHVVDLWSASGTLLATATSTNETASGWQQVSFSSPVNIVAGTTYVASYHMTNGQYSDTPYYFDTLQNPTNGSLSATANGLNGVFAYSSGSIFPTNIPASGDNYWVDVVLNDTGSTTETPPVLVTQTANQNAVVGSAFSLTLAGTFNDPDGGALTYSATGLNGAALPSWLTFNAATQTFSGTPASANVGTLG
ncbi:N,N-dimethylformamidase beta subunit family domain-containing protein, partial [Bradyrhizobium sp. Leo121]|uniref:N,N-dimethylformamidase beta subunit family domain-containing protein n=1 Tax=Bradyrhizobium sp. Leo121 TaxID=1571195 RepID=UPI001FE17226